MSSNPRTPASVHTIPALRMAVSSSLGMSVVEAPPSET